MKVNYYTVSRRAKRLGVAKSDAFMRASWKKGTPQKRIKGKEEMLQYLKARFHETRNAELAALFGVDVKTVRRMARKLGLEKSEVFMRSVRKKGDWTYYTPEQKAWRNRRIAEAYPEAGQEELRRLAEELGLNYGGLKSIAYSIGVRRSKRVRSESRRKVFRRPEIRPGDYRRPCGILPLPHQQGVRGALRYIRRRHQPAGLQAQDPEE